MEIMEMTNIADEDRESISPQELGDFDRETLFNQIFFISQKGIVLCQCWQLMLRDRRRRDLLPHLTFLSLEHVYCFCDENW